MKKLLFFSSLFLLFFIVQVSLAFDISNKPKSFVNDFTDTLSAQDKDSLESKISNFEKETSNEIAVVIIPSLDGDTVENIAQNIFTKWGIGKKGKDNGVLILIAMAEHKTRIHTGYGVEGDLTDLGTSYIQSEIMAPAFREGNYFSGIDKTLDKIIESLRGNNIVPEGYESKKGFKMSWEYILVIIFVALQWVIAILRRSKSWWGGGVLGAVVGGVIWYFAAFSLFFSIFIILFLIAFGLGLDYFVSRTYQKAKDSRKIFPWWIGGGHGGSGEGFGGFGGGFSGGGGSSGSW